MTKEERSRIARENGSKSHGPTTDAGKAKSSRNGIKTGEFAEKLAAFVPPDSAVLCNEQRQAYFNLVDQLTQIYAPINQESMNLVRQIAIARWQIERGAIGVCCAKIGEAEVLVDAGIDNIRLP